VIPTVEQVLDGYRFFARRHDLDPECSREHVAHAIALAQRLAVAPGDEPAAIFFAFVAERVAFPGALLAMTWQLVVNCARSNGHIVPATRAELGSLVPRIGRAEMSWQNVREWFATRIP
jgi:hypothetical protein